MSKFACYRHIFSKPWCTANRSKFIAGLTFNITYAMILFSASYEILTANTHNNRLQPTFEILEAILGCSNEQLNKLKGKAYFLFVLRILDARYPSALVIRGNWSELFIHIPWGQRKARFCSAFFVEGVRVSSYESYLRISFFEAKLLGRTSGEAYKGWISDSNIEATRRSMEILALCQTLWCTLAKRGEGCALFTSYHS